MVPSDRYEKVQKEAKKACSTRLLRITMRATKGS
ncbi:hypothetical protein CRT38_00560 [Anaplasma phagocytophilum str. CRT38]|uniref:Uncharacterized protein n=1 Tax=Anaplasma phagocytophilum str. CRT38 TaxID=1269275 RepID=S6G6L0_ANAPH|nr:hypothetical protein CRT38_00560 [Anaplasma phagocytophilum str. CRT38]